MDGADVDVSGDEQFDGTVVIGHLSGNGINIQISSPLGTNLEIGTTTPSAGDLVVGPPLLEPGNYTLDNLRLVDSSGTTILDAVPSTLTIRVIDRVIVSNLSTRSLSLDEIRERGIVIGDDNFTAYSFQFQLATESDPVMIDFDVLFPPDEEDDEDGDDGEFSFPPDVPGLDVPSFDATGIILDMPIDLPGVSVPPIPGVLVIPGNIAFLNQFFEVILLVSNVTPPGSQLVITAAAAELELPLGANGAPDDPLDPGNNDDPLRPADTEEGQALHPLCNSLIDPLLCAEVANTETGGASFGPGEDGRGLFLVEGRNVGTHRLKVRIAAELQIPGQQPVELTGSATGTVVVRHPTLNLSMNHPEVVRAGETYSVFVAVHNLDQTTGAPPANCIKLSLDPNQISGATLVDNSHTEPGACGVEALGTAFVPEIVPNDVAVVEYRFIARKNGRVTASLFSVETGAELTGGFVFRTGVGDLGIPLSPDSLVLPPYAHDLPDVFVSEALRVLGLAHSASTAPRGQNIGLANRVSTGLVKVRALELAEAGLRVRIGEQHKRELMELWLDWAGNVEWGAGFDEVMRRSKAGHDLAEAYAQELATCPGGESCGPLIDLHDAFGAAEAYRGDFLSVAASGGVEIAITDSSGKRLAGCAGSTAAQAAGRCPASNGAVERSLPGGSLVGFEDGAGFAGELALVGRGVVPGEGAAQPFGVTITNPGPAAAPTTLSVLAPGAAGEFRRFAFGGYLL